MAIQGKYIDKTGTTHTSAYAKIVDIGANYLNKRGYINLYIFHNKTARQNDKYPAGIIHYDFNATKTADEDGTTQITDNFSKYFYADNILQTLYDYLKTLNEWKDWADV